MTFTYADANVEMQKVAAKTLSYVRLMARWSPTERMHAGYNSVEEVLAGMRKQFDRLEKEYQKIEDRITEE